MSKPKRLVARVAASSTVALATIATSDRTGKVALQVVLVLVGAGQDVLAVHDGNFGKHRAKRLDGEQRVFTSFLDGRNQAEFVSRGAEVSRPVLLDGADQEPNEHLQVEVLVLEQK